MKAHGGVWNPVTNAWMFTNVGDHANAMCELYRTTRPSSAQLEDVPADVPSDIFDASPFEERARRGSRRRHSVA